MHFANCGDCSLTDSFLRCYDDSVCVRGYAALEYDRWLKGKSGHRNACKNIRVANCTIWNDWGKGLQVGTETYAEEICDIRFENCEIIRVSAGAMFIWLVDNARIHDVLFKNIAAEYDDVNRPERIQRKDGETYAYVYDAAFMQPFVMFCIQKHFEYSMIRKEEELGSIRGVRLENLFCFSRRRPVFVFVGHNEKSDIQNVVFDGVFWNEERVSKELFLRATSKNEFCADIVLAR